MPIDRDKLLADVKFYLGPLNQLDDDRILEIGESVIQEVGDDEENYPEVLCKTLKKCAQLNLQLATVNPSKGLKRQKSYNRELETHQDYNPVDYWNDYLNRLPQTCAALGYRDLPSRYSGMFKANVATPIRVPAGAPEYGTVERTADCYGNPCPNTSCCGSCGSFTCDGVCDDCSC